MEILLNFLHTLDFFPPGRNRFQPGVIRSLTFWIVAPLENL